MTDSIETSEADALPWAPDSSFPALVAGVSTEDHLRAQVLVLAALLGEALPVLKNVEAEGCDEAELLQHTITRSEAAVEAVLREHGVGVIDIKRLGAA